MGQPIHGSLHFHTIEASIVTGFNDSVWAVPEPSTWAMLILGFAGVGSWLIVAATTQRLTQPDLGPDQSQAKLERPPSGGLLCWSDCWARLIAFA